MQKVLLMVAVMASGGSFGYGCVLFEKCIVDASIFIFAMHTSFLVVCFVRVLCVYIRALLCVGCVCRCCCKCFRAFGGCLGTRSR